MAFTSLSHAYYRLAGPCKAGKQALGHSPGGAADQFAYQIGNQILDNVNQPAIEMVFGEQFQAEQDLFIFITGASWQHIFINDAPVPMNRVLKVNKNDMLTFQKRLRGLRTYICFRPYDKSKQALCSRQRLSYQILSDSWLPPMAERATIRLLHGPEKENVLLSDHPWTISRQSNEMGLRLECPQALRKQSTTTMISQPVTNGTVQLTPTGPIILLRERQTIGGYPRIANVIEADIDRLAQLSPGKKIQFTYCTLEDAINIGRAKDAVLQQKLYRIN